MGSLGSLGEGTFFEDYLTSKRDMYLINAKSEVVAFTINN